MPYRISKKTLYLNADRSQVVAEDDPAAAFLLVREGSQVNEQEAARLEKAGVDLSALKTKDHDVSHPRDLHEAEYATPQPEPVVEPEPDTDAKAKASAENKAVAKAPANKGK